MIGMVYYGHFSVTSFALLVSISGRPYTGAPRDRVSM
jgi:hypothetical protein